MRDKLRLLERQLKPLLKKLGIGDIYGLLSFASDLRVRRIALVTGISLERLVAAREILQSNRLLGLCDQDLDYARKYDCSSVSVFVGVAERANKRIEDAYSRL